MLESKRLSSGLKVLDNGECLTFRNGRPVAIDSPMEQNRRHVKILQRLFDSGAVPLPRRLGLTLKPKLHSLVLIAEGRITRPKAAVPGIESLIRTDLMFSHVERAAEKGSPLDLAKLVGCDTLEAIGQALASQHRPIEYDWQRRFGLADHRPAVAQPSGGTVVPLRPRAAAPPAPPAPPAAVEAPAETAAPAKPRPPAGQCDACEAPISAGVKSYCRKNAARFDNRILCMSCQPRAVASA